MAISDVACAREDVSLSSLPAVVQEVVKREFAGARVTSIDDDDYEGIDAYEIEGETPDGKELEIMVGKDGTLYQKEEEISSRDLPAPVLAAVKKELGNAQPEEFKRITERDKVLYEIEAEVSGKEIELKIAADGTIIDKEVEDEDGDDDDDDEGEGHGHDDAFPEIEIPKGDQHACVEKHVVVYDEPGRYAGWPANGGFWIWGDSLAVSFECGWFKDKPDWEDGHARDMDRSNEDIVARSSDGGLTWTHKTCPAMSSDDGMVMLKEEMDFSKEGFAFKCQGSRFYYTYDYGKSWAGPFELNIKGRPFDDDHIESHTCYLPTGDKEGYFFFGVEPDGAEDRFYCAKTTDGGKSFQFLGWISPSIEDAPKYERWAVYSAVEVSKGHLIAALRRKIDKRGGKVERLNWIDVYQSKDAGKTWSFLGKIADTDVVNSDFNGNPPSVIKLKDGRLAVTYGFRGRPTAMCAKLSKDNGKTWGDVVILRRGSRNWDFGYSRSLQKPDGRVITVYYWATPEHRNQYLTATIWDPAKVE
jgi:hypothetical protein